MYVNVPGQGRMFHTQLYRNHCMQRVVFTDNEQREIVPIPPETMSITVATDTPVPALKGWDLNDDSYVPQATEAEINDAHFDATLRKPWTLVEKAFLVKYARFCAGGFIQWKKLETNINGGFCRRVAPGVIFCSRNATTMRSAYTDLMKGSSGMNQQQRAMRLAFQQHVEAFINNEPEMLILQIAFNVYGIPYAKSQNGRLSSEIREIIEPHVNRVLLNRRNRKIPNENRNNSDLNGFDSLLLVPFFYSDEEGFERIVTHATSLQMARLRDSAITVNSALDGELAERILGESRDGTLGAANVETIENIQQVQQIQQAEASPEEHPPIESSIEAISEARQNDFQNNRQNANPTDDELNNAFPPLEHSDSLDLLSTKRQLRDLDLLPDTILIPNLNPNLDSNLDFNSNPILNASLNQNVNQNSLDATLFEATLTSFTLVSNEVEAVSDIRTNQTEITQILPQKLSQRQITVCYHCNFDCNTHAKLRLHLCLLHNSKFECLDCSMHFDSMNLLFEHLQQRHPNAISRCDRNKAMLHFTEINDLPSKSMICHNESTIVDLPYIFLQNSNYFYFYFFLLKKRGGSFFVCFLRL